MVVSVPSVAAMALTIELLAVNTMSAVFLPIAADLARAAYRLRVTSAVSFVNRLIGYLVQRSGRRAGGKNAVEHLGAAPF